MTKVKFKNLGRWKATFEASIKELDHGSLLKAVRPYLMSRDVEFSVDPDTNEGRVLVGGFRAVGTFKVLEEK